MDPISLSESLKRIKEFTAHSKRSSEKIATREALHRVTATPLYAQRANPSQNTAAMDGIAVDFRKFTVPARLAPGEWQRISTGEPLPPYWNAVVRTEDVILEKEFAVLEKPVEYLQNIRIEGEDFPNDRLLFAPGHFLQPQDLSLLVAAGLEEIEVFCKPVITFLPTGSELIVDSREQREGCVLETNSIMIAGMVESWGGILHRTKPIEDDAQVLVQKIKTYASKSDILILSAGTSRGIRDLTAKAVEEASGIIHFHGVAIQPGKPVFFAEVGGVPVIGLPGYPAAAYIAAHLYLRPLVAGMSGVRAELPRPNFISAEDLAPRPVDTFYRVQLYDVEGQVYAQKISHGASSLSDLSEMDGIMHVPPSTAIKKRDAVRIDVIRDRALNTIVARGVEDLNVMRLFYAVRETLPYYRFLFFETTSEDALQSIVERNSHLAIINTPEEGVDIFSPYSKQLQEPQHRYRMFTRTAGLILRSVEKRYATLAEAPMGLRIAAPEKREPLWDQFRFAVRLDELKFHPEFCINNEKFLINALDQGQWEAVFADIRFMRDNQYCLATVREHVDLIVPESFLTLEPVKKLIEVLLAEPFARWLSLP